jgi:4-amino-4-deoxy-L-arabinose transferase-like glycosyltransferase
MTEEPTLRGRYLCVSLLLLALAVAAALQWIATAGGMSVGIDSVIYLDGARHIAEGAGYSTALRGITEPLGTHFPPGYSIALAAMSFVSHDLLGGARLLGLLARLGLLIVTWAGLTRLARVNRWVALAAVGVLATAPDLTLVHAVVLSEPLFLVTAVSGLFLVTRSLTDGRRWLWLGGLVLGLAVVTRYAGLGIAAAVPLVLLARGGRPWRSRLADVGIFACAALAPLAVWLASQMGHAAPGAGQRALALHVPGVDAWLRMTSTVAGWMFPAGVPALAGLLPIGLVAAALALARPSRANGGDGDTPGLPVGRVFLLAFLGYLGMLVAAAAAVDSAVALFDGRLLSPALVLAVIGIASLARRGARPGPRVGGVVCFAVVLLTVSNAARAYTMARRFESYRQFSSQPFARLSSEVRATGARVAFSNAWIGLYFQGWRQVRALPSPLDPATGRANPRFAGTLRAMCPWLAATGSSVLVVTPFLRPELDASVSDLVRLGHLRARGEGWGWILLRPEICD